MQKLSEIYKYKNKIIMEYKMAFKCKNCQTKMMVVAKDGMYGSKQAFRCKDCGEITAVMVPAEEVFIKKFSAKKPTTSNAGATMISTNMAKQTYLKLEMQESENTKKQVFDIDQEKMTIGRKNNAGFKYKPDIEIQTTDNYMSKIHAQFSRKKDKSFTIADLGSANGTWLNGDKLNSNDEEYVEDGDKIKVGRSYFKIKIVTE